MTDQRIIGIGIGPANLSLAALLDTSRDRSSDLFFEAKPSFQWHRGMMVPDSMMQVHFLKDLVTPVDPTNPHSILAYLVGRGEFYHLLNTRRRRISRREFEAYCSWVASRLESTRFSSEVLSVQWADRFKVTTADGTFRSRHLSVGTGVRPKLPKFLTGVNQPTVTHSADFLFRPPPRHAKHLLVVGGGQSGAEVVVHLLDTVDPDAHIHWITRRSNFLPLDESPFVEDYFTPRASDQFFQLPAGIQARLLVERQLASDGISESVLEQIYRQMYDVRNGYQEGPTVETRSATELVGLDVADPRRIVATELDRLVLAERQVVVDYVVLATGYEQAMPEALAPLMSRIAWEEDRPSVRSDFSVLWDGPEANRIFLQNGARHVRGVADPNLSLLAWRSATVALSVAPDLASRFLDPSLAGSSAEQMPTSLDDAAADEPVASRDRSDD